MSLSSPFIRRPVGTSLLTAAVTLAGALAYVYLPVSPLPQIDFPTISVSASLPGASPATMASAVATPLERQFGRIAGITEMSSTSYLGSTSITIQFDLSRNIDAAARDVQAAINAASGQLPTNLPSKPTYRKINPADSAILIRRSHRMFARSPKSTTPPIPFSPQKVSQIDGVGQVFAGGGSPPAVRIEVNPTELNNWQLGLDDVRTLVGSATVNRPKGSISQGNKSWFVGTTDQLLKAPEYRPLIIAYRNGAPVRLGDVAHITDSVEDVRAAGLVRPQAVGALDYLPTARRKHHRDRRPHSRFDSPVEERNPGRDRYRRCCRPLVDHSGLRPRRRNDAGLVDRTGNPRRFSLSA